ncbi:MAG: hypothetical protein QMD12_02865 [Candidatus Aenigmarchaeota archaeon]|nr:hypothetical protein [Candidatus Aenigmarchaeota archaeon]
MDLIAHFVFGLWLFKKSGNVWSIALSCVLDIDHILGYIYDKRKKRYIEIPSILHLAYRPRSWLHSITGALISALPFVFFLPMHIVLISLFSHLFFDLLDRNGILLFPPLLKKKIKGALPVGYLIEDPEYLKRHRRSHIPSLILIVLFSLFIVFGI